jgi:SagB-type dehydrogenase family enzyme
VQTYLYIKPERVEGVAAGTYYYHPAEHQLVLLTPDSQVDQSIHSAVNRALFNESAFSIFLIGQLSAITPMYGELGRHYAAIEAGLMTQLLEMSAPACELGLCQIGSLAFDRISKFFNLEESHVLLHSLVGGQIDPVQTKLPALLEELNEYRAVSELFRKEVTKDGPGRKGASPTDRFISEVKSSLRGRLPDYMIPSSYVLLNTLPLTSNGKVDRKALPPPDEVQTEQLPETYTAPETEIEQVIAAVMQEVLKLDQVSVHRNFFDLGGTSVHMIQVYNKVRALLQKDFPVLAVFEHPTVRALAKYLDEGAETARPLLKQGVDRGVQRKEEARQKQRQRKRKEAVPVPPRN